LNSLIIIRFCNEDRERLDFHGIVWTAPSGQKTVALRQMSLAACVTSLF
jgi:hypothetical protein